MRVLVTTLPAFGHFYPMVAFSWALRSAGHQVLVAGPRLIVNEARNAGLAGTVVSDVSVRDLWAASDDPSGEDNHRPIADLGLEIADRAATDVLQLCRDWRPDVVMSDPMEFAGPLAAGLAGVPTVSHRWGLHCPDELISSLWESAGPKRRALHDRFGIDAAALEPHAVLDTCPPGLRRTENSSWISMRYVPYCGNAVLPRWLTEPRAKPRVCVSMSSLPMRQGLEALSTAARALSDTPVEVVLSGTGSRDSSLGALPPNVRAPGWLPHDQLLSACDAVVHHGGAGSSMVSLTKALPQIVVPQLGDQFANAEQLERRGIAHRIAVSDLSEEAVAEGVERVLEDPAYRNNAAELRSEIEAMRSPTRAVAEFESAACAASTGATPPEPVPAP